MNKTKEATKEATQYIVIAQSGWVFVGELTYEPGPLGGGSMAVLNNAKNIRVWGTKNGLGELALRGAQPQTVLDVYGVVKVPQHAILALIECQAEL